jgi:hypothetical protein
MSWGQRRDVSATHRSSRLRGTRRSDSRSTALDIERTQKTSPSTNLIAVPDDGRPLSDGLLVEASIVARLLRIRLLAIDARLIVTPAHVQRRTPTPVTLCTRGPRIGAGLAAAERMLDEPAAGVRRVSKGPQEIGRAPILPSRTHAVRAPLPRGAQAR